MAVSFYTDVHLPQAIVDGLRLRGVDVLTSIEDGMRRLTDDDLLRRAHSLRRVMVTQDHRFAAMAEQWQRDGTAHSGVAYGRQRAGSIGDYVTTLEIIAFASEPDEWLNRVERIPY